MPWNSCLFRKIHMPFTDTRACVFRKGGRGAAGLWQAVPAAMPPLRGAGGGRHEGRSPARPSSAGPALRGEDSCSPLGTFPGALTAGPCAQEGASAPGGGGTHAILRLLAAQPAVMEVRAGLATWFECRRWASWCDRTDENSYLAAPSPQGERLSGCEGGSGTVGAMPGGSWSLALQCPAQARQAADILWSERGPYCPALALLTPDLSAAPTALLQKVDRRAA